MNARGKTLRCTEGAAMCLDATANPGTKPEQGPPTPSPGDAGDVVGGEPGPCTGPERGRGDRFLILEWFGVPSAMPHATRGSDRSPPNTPFTPKHNGKVERYQRTLAEELLYARPDTCEADRATAIAIWNIHYNYHRPHTAAGNQPPASRLHQGVTNVMRSHS